LVVAGLALEIHADALELEPVDAQA